MLRWLGQQRELDCRQVEGQLTAYLKGGLSPDRRQAVRAHLATCDACVRAVREAEALEAELYVEAVRHRPTLSAQALTRIQERVYRRMRRGLIMQRARFVTERAMALVVVLALAAGALALWQWMRPPIETTDYTGESTVITFACMDFQRDRYQDLAEEFHKLNPAITVDFVSVDEVTGHGPGVASTEDIHKMAAAADTFPSFSGMLGSAPQDIALDLTELAEKDEEFTLEDFYTGPLALFQSDGKLWGLPLRADTPLIFFNPKLFDAAGVPPPQIGWSWDDFLEAALRLTIREGETVKQYGYMDPYPYYSLPLLAHQKTGQLLDQSQDPPSARLNTPGVAEALQWYADLILAHGVMPNPETMDTATRQLFPDRQSPAMWMGFSYDEGHFRDVSVVPFPQDGRVVASITAHGYLISAGTEHPEAAWRWIEFLSRQPPDKYSNSIPARRSVTEETDYWKKLDKETATVHQYALERTVNYPRAIYGELYNAWKAVLEGEPVKVALAAAQERANARLAQAEAEAQRAPREFSVATPVPTPTPGGILIRFLAPPGTDLMAYRNLVDRFREIHPDIAVEISTGGGGSLAEQAVGADCFAWYAHGLGLQDRSVLLTLDPFLADDEAFDLDVFAPAFLEPVQVDGKLWALPLETDAWLLYYNRALFDTASAPHPSAGWTPQKLVEQAIALADLSLPEPIYGFYPRDGAYANAPDYVAWLGGQLFSADGRPTFADPTVSEALVDYVNLITKATPPSAAERGESRWPYPTWWGGHPGPVRLGRVAMWIDRYGNHRSAPSLDFEIGVAPLPAGTVPLTSFSPRALFISAQTPYAAACWNWIAFLSAQPEAASQLPLRYDVAMSDDWRNQVREGVVEAWLAVLDRGEIVQRPWATSTAFFSLYWFDEALADILVGARPAATLARAQEKAAAFADCVAAGEIIEETYRTCARQADPKFEWPLE